VFLVLLRQGGAGSRHTALHSAMDDIFVDDVGCQHREQRADGGGGFSHVGVESLVQVADPRHGVEQTEANGFVNRAVEVEALHRGRSPVASALFMRADKVHDGRSPRLLPGSFP
jgi:hypothetical protein